MFSMMRWMLVYGLMLIAGDLLVSLAVVHVGSAGRAAFCCWVGGLLMIVAAILVAQGRRSLRVSGLYLGMLLPLILAGIFAWRASNLWREQLPTRPMLPAMYLSSLSLISLIVLAVLVKLRPRDGIASRGYSIPIKHDPLEIEPRHSSKAG